MKKNVTTICVCLISCVFVFMFVYCMFFTRTTKSDYSHQKEFPEFSFEKLKSGEYLKDITYYFSDTIHGRDRFIDYEAKIRGLYGLAEEEVAIDLYEEPEENKNISEVSSDSSADSDDPSESDISQTESGDGSGSSQDESNQDETSSPVSNPEDPDDPDIDKQDVELSGTILILGNRTMEVFYGNKAGCIRYANVLNDFAERLDKNVNIYSMVVPKASAYYIKYAKQESYSKTAPCNKENIDLINENLCDRIIPIDAYGALEKHVAEDIYYRTDHHWTSLAAYYAAQEFATTLGLPFDDLSNFDTTVREGYIGTMYKYSGYNPKVLNNPENLVSYIPRVPYETYYCNKTDLSHPWLREGGLFWNIPDSQRSSWYSTYIMGDVYSVHVKSGVCNNGRKLLIVKDSYGNPLSQYLLQSFEEIYIVDSREYKTSLEKTISDNGITDVLFVECTFSAVSEKFTDFLKELCK